MFDESLSYRFLALRKRWKFVKMEWHHKKRTAKYIRRIFLFIFIFWLYPVRIRIFYEAERM